MKSSFYHHSIFMMVVCALACFSVGASAQRFTQADFARAISSNTQVTTTGLSSSAPQLIQPEEQARLVQFSKRPKPLILYVGFHVRYLQA